MKSIRTKENGKGSSVKSTALASKTKQGLIRSKEQAKRLSDSRQDTPEEYAQDNIRYASEDLARDSVHASKNAVRKTYDGSRRLVQQIKQKKKTAEDIKQTAKSTGKTTLKTAKRNIKTARKSVESGQRAVERSTRVTIKTSEKTAKAAEKTVKASEKAAKAAAKTAKKSAEAARKAAKKAAEATYYAVKAVVKGIKKLIVLIAAGGWVAVLIIAIILMVGLIIVSAFGLFYSGGGNSDSGITLDSAIVEINEEYQDRLETIKEENEHDRVEMSGSRAVWKEVLTVYSVRVVGDPDNPQEVATMDEGKKQILKEVFWDMNQIEYSVETKEVSQASESVDEDGNISEETRETTQTVLSITVSHKTPDEMAAQYGFSEKQNEQLAEMLSEKNAKMWDQLLKEIGGTTSDIVTLAYSQIGNEGGQPYWSWYGFSERVEWCACFVSWCANQCGYIDSGVIPKFAGCSYAVDWFAEREQWQERTYTPSPGDIIFFDWRDNGVTNTADHVGIVEKVVDDRVYTVEGNSGDAVHERDYPIGYDEILGYGVPRY